MTWRHVVAGSVGLVAGGVALCATKGGELHRRSGMVFLWAMLVLSTTGAALAALQPTAVSVIAGVLTFYLVMTAWLTVRPSMVRGQWAYGVAMLIAETLGLAAVAYGFEAVGRVDGREHGQPAAMYFVFGAVALLAALGDLRLLLGRGLEAPLRTARYLWRMCFALFLATGSFFLGQARLFPIAVRDSGLLAVPVLAVMLATVFWLVRVRFVTRDPNALAPASATPLCPVPRRAAHLSRTHRPA